MASETGKPGPAVGPSGAGDWIPTLVRGVLAFLFLWAAVSKLGNPSSFLGSLYAYDLPIPRALLKAVAVALPWIELLCGLLLLARVWSESALLLLGGLLAIFLVATAQAWARGLQISCGCFDLSLLGINPGHTEWLMLVESPAFAFVRNLVLLSATVYLFRQTRLAAAVPTPSEPPLVDGHRRRRR